jgi:hypothetical protein
LVVLAALAFVITIISMLASRPSLMFGAAIAALGPGRHEGRAGRHR